MNGEGGTGNGERGTGNGERETENEKRRTGNGEFNLIQFSVFTFILTNYVNLY